MSVEEDGDMGFDNEDCNDEESEPRRAEKKEKFREKERGNTTETKNMTLHEKMMALMSLQTASGHFAEDKMIGVVIGKPLEDLKAQVPDLKPESMKSWLTSIMIAFQ